ncbi:hypothetical protein NQ315_006987 [Exocentrus adspersus]|uniref:Carboxylic ester hydrolase n=1 Tax=Exocentrus adspersus TaxID=1586481 RepID=A0AAV8WCA4_9CUCU|nr:hypothetical protein NQ315_006987 [Exocentrus adspersus]
MFQFQQVAVSDDAQSGTEDVIVEVNSGRVQGRRIYSQEINKNFYAFQGIPYAQPPVGDLRFEAPLPAEKWDGVLAVQEDERKCVQEFTGEGSEDCLYINVFTPEINSTAALPVMVWIYGGAFREGSSKIQKFSPDYFIGENVIVVTFNYRLGVFGFLSTEDMASPGNYALKDQILALEWVRDNIDYFGGNPNSVTVFGQSAGAASVSYLLQTPLAKNLFHRAIMQSGTSLNLWALTRNPRTTAFAIGRAFDIDTSNSSILVQALKRIETRTLQAVSVSREITETVSKNPRDGLVFGPSTEPFFSGAVVRKKSHQKLNYGNFNAVPCMVGFTSQEGLPITSMSNFVKPYFFTYDLFSTRLVPIDMNAESFWKIPVALLIKQRYFGFMPVGLSNDWVIQFVTDDQFVRPIHEYVSLVSKYIPVYFYRFSYEGKLGEENRNNRGVGHGEELSYLWKQENNVVNPPDSDLKTRQRLIKLWTNFAKTSNPTPEHDELLQDVTWPTSTFKNIVYLDIGHNLTVSSDMSKYNIQFWKNLYNTNGVPPYDTY